MLDPVACGGMACRWLTCITWLIERGFRRSSRDDSKIVLEEQDKEPADTGAAANGTASRHKRSIPPGFGG
jgi:hypothetical protein